MTNFQLAQKMKNAGKSLVDASPYILTIGAALIVGGGLGWVEMKFDQVLLGNPSPTQHAYQRPTVSTLTP